MSIRETLAVYENPKELYATRVMLDEDNWIIVTQATDVILLPKPTALAMARLIINTFEGKDDK